ncbi:MAG: type II secretion system protein [bacterium]
MKKGFTLLELLIVVVILGVLALIAAPALLNATDKSKDAAVKQNIASAASTLSGKFATEADTATAITATRTALAALGTVNPVTGTGSAYAAGATPTLGQVGISLGDDGLVAIQGSCKLATATECVKKVAPPTTAGSLTGLGGN